MSPRREVTERLPDPVEVEQGRMAIDSASEGDIPDEYIELTNKTLPLRRERKDEK
jgi:hypothetical protein